MPIELLSMLGGGVAGFIFKFVATQQEAQERAFERVVKAQDVSDTSNDRAAVRGTIVGRRVLLFTILWVVAFAPFVAALVGIPTYVETERAPWDVLGWFTGGFERLEGVIVIEELRAAVVAAVGFYLGSGTISRRLR
jgi:hypothetical protein